MMNITNSMNPEKYGKFAVLHTDGSIEQYEKQENAQSVAARLGKPVLRWNGVEWVQGILGDALWVK